MNFFSDETIKVWIAPIITGVIVALIVAFITLFIKRKNTVNYINTISAAEEKLIEILRPFFIQELELTEDVLIDSRKSIIREYKLRDDKFISIQEIKEIIILDILRTRFIKEEDKKRLIESTYNTFNKYKNSVQKDKDYIKTIYFDNAKSINEDETKVEKYNSLLSILASIIAVLITLIMIPLIIKPSDNKNVAEILISLTGILQKTILTFLGVALVVVATFIIYIKTKEKIRFRDTSKIDSKFKDDSKKKNE